MLKLVFVWYKPLAMVRVRFNDGLGSGVRTQGSCYGEGFGWVKV